MAKPRSAHHSDRHFDYLFLFCTIFLVIFGLVMLSSASFDLGKKKYNDPYYYLKHQLLVGLIFGGLGFLFASNFNYLRWEKLSFILLLINILLLILVFIPGLSYQSGSASRWLKLGSFSFQPAELLKFTFIIYLAAWLSKKKQRKTAFIDGLLPFLVISLIIAVLVLKQPATATLVIVLASALVVYFVSGAKFKYIVLIILIGAILFSIVIYKSNYRRERVQTFIEKFFLKKDVDILDKGFHIRQSLMAIGSGKLFGVGFGKSIIKYRSLPETVGDSIFAVIAEELGFVGSVILIGLYALLFFRGLKIAQKSKDEFGRLTVIGLISVVSFQVFVHIGANTGLLPFTGVPLPFISYGGTALAVFLTMMGVIVNISKYS